MPTTMALCETQFIPNEYTPVGAIRQQPFRWTRFSMHGAEEVKSGTEREFNNNKPKGGLRVPSSTTHKRYVHIEQQIIYIFG